MTLQRVPLPPTYTCVLCAGEALSSRFVGLGPKISASEMESDKNLPGMHDFRYLQNLPRADHIPGTLGSVFHVGKAELHFLPHSSFAILGM